jgi:hypothetical protein
LDARAWVRVSGVGRVIVDRAVCDHALALVGVLEERRNGTEQQGKRDRVERKKERRINVLSSSLNTSRHTSS